MRNYFEEMNIDYDELKRYEDIETYYDEVQDYSKLIQELQCDRVEVLKQIVNKNKEIERLNKENKELKSDLEYVMEQTYGALTQNWCIDWNFTNIREKYNISNKLGSDK